MTEIALWILFTVSLAAPAAARLGQWNWFADFFSHFKVHEAGLLVITSFVAALFGHPFAASVAALAALYEVFSMRRYYPRRRPSFPYGGTSLRVLTANLYSLNRRHDDFIRIVRREKPDVMVVVEYTGLWHEALQRALGEYHFHAQPQEGFFGIAVLTKIAALETHTEILSPKSGPAIQCVFKIGEAELVLWAVHPRAPKSIRKWKTRNEYLKNLGIRIRQDQRPAIVAGDLNTSPWCPWFMHALAGRLRDTAAGWGLSGTWPSRLPGWLRIPLDHILASPDFRVADRRILEPFGSDHRPVVASLSFRNSGTSCHGKSRL